MASHSATLIDEIRSSLGAEWLPLIYRDKIRSQRTRAISIEIPARENVADIQHTLLGIELKVGKNRFSCPDLSTARYMRVFARLGCDRFAIPYDITRISAAADELDTAWHRAVLMLDEAMKKALPRAKTRDRNRLIAAMRVELTEIGAGEQMPSFDRETRQRKP